MATIPLDWLLPMPRLADGRPPVISDGWGSQRDGGARTHKGVDVMYRRPRAVSSAEARREHGSQNYEVPRGTPVYAARAGVIANAVKTERGHGVLVDHGDGWSTFYQHLEGLERGVAKGRRVLRGQRLGTVGYSLADGAQIRHLHFEVWRNGVALDPQAMMATWPAVPARSFLVKLALAGFVAWGINKLLR